MIDLKRENAQLRAQIAELSLDKLTRIPGRHLGDQRLAEDWNRWKRGGYEWKVTMIDVDHFKGYNDENGHQSGDAALHSVAQELSSRIRAGDFLFRWGGDEFMITSLHPTECEKRLPGFAERLREAIDFHTPVTVSLGVAVADNDDFHEDVSGMIERADRSLYAAKQAGRNRSVGA